MPRKIRQLINDLVKAGFVDRGGKGSHRNFTHEPSRARATLSGHENADALRYQEKEVKQALAKSQKTPP